MKRVLEVPSNHTVLRGISVSALKPPRNQCSYPTPSTPFARRAISTCLKPSCSTFFTITEGTKRFLGEIRTIQNHRPNSREFCK